MNKLLRSILTRSGKMIRADNGQVYSERLGRIPESKLQQALDLFDLGMLISAQPAGSGLFGQNIFLLSDQGEFVFRGCPHSSDQFLKEKYFIEELHKQTRVPVPFPFRLEESSALFGWSFGIMPRLPGVSPIGGGSRMDCTPGEHKDIARALARNLREMQRLTYPQSGFFDEATCLIRPVKQGLHKWMADFIHEKVDEAMNANGHTTEADVSWINKIVAELFDRDVAGFVPCFVHADYGAHNATVQRTENGWAVTGVFDFMTAYVGNGEIDLCSPVYQYVESTPEVADVFLEEYFHDESPNSGFRERQRFYSVSLMVSMWAYWQKQKGHVPGDSDGSLSFTDWAHGVVEYWNKFRD